MNVGEALDKIASKKSKLNRLNSMRSKLFNLKKDTEIEYDYEEITGQIQEIHNEIIDLKLNVQKSNIQRKIEIKMNDEIKEITKMEAILIIGKLTAELKEVQSNELRLGSSRSYLSSDEDREYHRPISETEREQLIEDLEKEKKRISLALQADNWKTELPDAP